MLRLWAVLATSFCASLTASCAVEPGDNPQPSSDDEHESPARASQALFGQNGGGWEGTNCGSSRPVGCTCTTTDECTVLGWFCKGDGDSLRCSSNGKCTCVNDKYICLFGCDGFGKFGGF